MRSLRFAIDTETVHSTAFQWGKHRSALGIHRTFAAKNNQFYNALELANNTTLRQIWAVRS